MPLRKTPLTSKELQKRFLANLKESGINAALAKKLKLKSMPAEELKKLGGPNMAAFEIPYFDLKGKPLKFSRYRLLEESTWKMKYFQPKGTPPHPYFMKGIPWQQVAKDTAIPIGIVEGEKKAIRGCLDGTPFIGIGGVWSFMSKKRGQYFLEELEEFSWKQRTVYLVFDNDITNKPEVQMALNELIGRLIQRGAEVIQLVLPPGEKYKGLDDALENGLKLENLEQREFEGSVLWDMNKRVAFLKKMSCFYDLENGILLNRASARDHFANILTPDGASAFPIWIKWPHRREHSGLTYVPRKQQIINDEINIYTAPAIKPKSGTISKWQEFMETLVQSVRGDDEYDYLEWWLAHTVARPDIKIYTAVIMHSEQEGTGKTLCFHLMKPLVGDYNFTFVSHEAIHNHNYNDWAERCKLAVINEAFDNSDRRTADRLKDLKTSEETLISKKYVSNYTVPNYMSIAITSNRDIPQFITKQDRRHFVIHATEIRPPRKKFKDLITWWEKDGARCVYHHFLNSVDLNRFDPKAEPPKTAAHGELVEASKPELQTLVEEFQAAPHKFIPNPIKRHQELWTTSDIAVFLQDKAGYKIRIKSLARALKSVGYQAKVFKFKRGTMRLWILNNEKRWLIASGIEAERHYNEHTKTKV